MDAPERLVIEYLDVVWTNSSADRASEFIGDGYDLGELGRGPSAAEGNVQTFRAAFPDLIIEVQDVVADEDRVAVWMRLSGTHRGEFRGYAATGRTVAWDEVGFFTVRDGKIVAGRFLADMFGLRKAIGVLPDDMR